jgi:hypothetical protein
MFRLESPPKCCQLKCSVRELVEWYVTHCLPEFSCPREPFRGNQLGALDSSLNDVDDENAIFRSFRDVD